MGGLVWLRCARVTSQILMMATEGRMESRMESRMEGRMESRMATDVRVLQESRMGKGGVEGWMEGVSAERM